ncbi:hypothetical protein HYD72_00060 [Mycoplasmopsis bovis]|nr:hypothetical protein [Mycoplasmopsis bovis]QQH49196.1 hypothetical protein HYD72_00060 [Mycoplasmopsis bovis]
MTPKVWARGKFIFCAPLANVSNNSTIANDSTTIPNRTMLNVIMTSLRPKAHSWAYNKFNKNKYY